MPINEIEIGMRILSIESWTSNIPKDNGNVIRDYMNPWHRGSTDKIFVEYVGSNMDIQVPLLDIERGSVSGHVCIVLEPAGSAHLRFDDVLV